MTGADPRRLRVFVTVGMGPWPFDRLLRAVAPLTGEHDVVVQRGTSGVALDCPSPAFLGWEETQQRLREADVVITHAGNTVRLVQRLGKVPIVIARESVRGEMRNDHQVDYLAAERSGRVIALDGDLTGLPAAVRDHPRREAELLASAAPLYAPDAAALRTLLDDTLTPAADTPTNPFLRHPTRRYAWAFAQLRSREGTHLDLGLGDGTFLRALHAGTRLRVIGADAHAGYLAELHRGGEPPLLRMRERIPLRDGVLDSVSMLDSLEHVPDDAAMLAEVARTLRPGGLLVLSVPARHVFTVLDPDNAKYHLPRVHAAVYRARFGAAAYRERFADTADGLRGDLAVERQEHTNYRPEALLDMVTASGFSVQARDGANLFWRFVQVPQLLLPGRVGACLDAPLRWDGATFHRANLFLRAVRSAR